MNRIQNAEMFVAYDMLKPIRKWMNTYGRSSKPFKKRHSKEICLPVSQLKFVENI